MTQSAAPPIRPAGAPTGEERDTVHEAAARAQYLEDFCLAERIERALCASGYGPLRDLGVAVHARLVILRGRVPTYYLKQLAQATALAVPGTYQVRNDLDVGRPS
jgi:osmotically-inducible protein OsmY